MARAALTTKQAVSARRSLDPVLPYYVYELVDPRNGEPFYVGKGTNRRAWQHEADVRAGRVLNADKSARIRAIIEAGLSVQVEIVERYADEAAAYDAERERIRRGEQLTNIASGTGKPETAKERQLRELQGFKRDWMSFEEWRGRNPEASPLEVEIAAKLHPWVDELLRRISAGEPA